jgi:hypothetical protein
MGPAGHERSLDHILNPESIAGDPVVIWSDYLKRYVVIFDDTNVVSYADSPDGIHWAPAVPLFSGAAHGASALYAVPAGIEGNPNVIGQEFYILLHFLSHPIANRRRLDVMCEE